MQSLTALTSEKVTEEHCEHTECIFCFKSTLPKKKARRPKVTIQSHNRLYQKDDSYSTKPIGAIPAARKNAKKNVPTKSSVKSAVVYTSRSRETLTISSLDDPKLNQEYFVKTIR